MPIVTLTTDFGLKDHFIGAAKGKLLKKNPEAQIIDISHCIDYYNVSNASYVAFAAYKSFVKQTVHILSVGAHWCPTSKYLLMLIDGHYFLSVDNGTLTMLANFKAPEKIIKLHKRNFNSSMELFSEVIFKLSTNEAIENLGQQIQLQDCLNLKELTPDVSDDLSVIKGHFIYTDHYGNAVTNLSGQLFEKIRKGRSFEFFARNLILRRINKYYSDFELSENKTLKDEEGSALLLFNSADFLQLSIYKGAPKLGGTAQSLLGISYRDSFTIKFK